MPTAVQYELSPVASIRIIPMDMARKLSEALRSERTESGEGTLLLKDEQQRTVGVLIDVDGYNLLRMLSDLASHADRESLIPEQAFTDLEDRLTLEEVFEK